MAESKIEARDCNLFYKVGNDKSLGKNDEEAIKQLCKYFENTNSVRDADDEKIALLQTLCFPYDNQAPTVQTRWWAGRYIGQAQIAFPSPSGRGYCYATISIRPRFGEAFLLAVIEDVYNIKVGQQNAKVSKSEEWFSSLLNVLRRTMWVEKCAKANRYGLPRINVKREQQGVSLRGTLDVRRTIMPWLTKKEICSHVYEKTLDDTLCRIVYEAHRILSRNVINNKGGKNKPKTGDNSQQGIGFSIPPTVQDTINALNSQYKGILFDITEHDYQRIRYKSIYASWKPLVDFSWDVIRNRKLSYQAADVQTDCVFVDMAEIWESFLRKKLGEGFADDGWRVLSVEECHYRIYNGTFYERDIIPDIILEKDGKYMVFDAKYKRMRGIKTSGKQSDVDRSDLFQIHTYIQFVQHHLGDVMVGGLLYPITRSGLDDEGNAYQHSDDIDISLYHSEHLFGYECNHETRFIIDGIVCDENHNDDRSVAEIKEQMDRNIQSMINRIKNIINL